MPPPRKVDLLPDDERAWLDAELVRRGFSGYHALSELLAERGYEISHSALGQHGLELKKSLADVRVSTQMAKFFAEAARDDEANLSEAVISLVQTGWFKALAYSRKAADADAADDSPEAVNLLSKASKAVSELSRASVNQKRFAADVRRKLETLEKEAAVPGSGLDAETLRRVRQDVYGLAA